MVITRILAALAAVLLLPQTGWGQTPRASSDDSELLLSSEPLVTTAAKTPLRVSDAPAPVTVITEEDIRRSGATSLTDLLRGVPGVDVLEPNRSQPNVAIRGFNQQFANKLLVMVDGRSIYQDFYGTVFWVQEPILLSRIARIEIVRGPGSALYGANAFGGVINIITKTPQEMSARGPMGDARIARGEQQSVFAESSAAADLSGGWSLALGAGYHATDGWAERAPGQAIDRFKTPVFSADAQKDVRRGTWRLTANHSASVADLDSIFVIPDGHWLTEDWTAEYREKVGAAPFQVRAFENLITLRAPGYDITSRTYDLEAQQERALTERHRLVYGASYRAMDIAGFLTGGENRGRQSWSAYAQDQYQVGPATNLFGGLRVDDNSQYGTNLSPRLSLVHHLPGHQTVRLSYGTSFRAPTVVDEYFAIRIPVALPFPFPPLVEQAVGNPELRPERMTSLEAGYRHDVRRGYVAASAYYNRLSDLIATRAVKNAPPPFPAGIPQVFQSVNAGDATAYGLELEAGGPILRGVKGQIDWSWEHARRADGRCINFTPESRFNVSLMSDRSDARFDYRLDVHTVSEEIDQETFGAPDPRTLTGGLGGLLQNLQGHGYSLGSYVRADARIAYRFGDHGHPWTFSLSGTNLLGAGHEEFPEIHGPVSLTPEAAPARRTLWAALETKW